MPSWGSTRQIPQTQPSTVLAGEYVQPSITACAYIYVHSLLCGSASGCAQCVPSLPFFQKDWLRRPRRTKPPSPRETASWPLCEPSPECKRYYVDMYFVRIHTMLRRCRIRAPLSPRARNRRRQSSKVHGDGCRDDEKKRHKDLLPRATPGASFFVVRGMLTRSRDFAFLPGRGPPTATLSMPCKRGCKLRWSHLPVASSLCKVYFCLRSRFVLRRLGR